MLERMDSFFDHRVAIYDEHQLSCIAGAAEFFPFTASLLPRLPDCRVLDLGCGTGLELEHYWPLNPTAHITGIDLSRGMLDRLREKFPRKKLDLICGSYFDVPFGENTYDAAVSVESLHHFTAEQKLPLYRRLYAALKPGGSFILTDYFALSDEQEQQYRAAYLAQCEQQQLDEGVFYHFDTPLTVEHERECLLSAGFSAANILQQWEQTFTIGATKG